jgi:peptidoglycan-N-acetylglucosamine deacetylase
LNVEKRWGSLPFRAALSAARMKKFMKIFADQRKSFAIALCGILVLLAAGTYSVSWLMKYQLLGEYVRKISTDKKILALTFDDGPNPTVTERILGVLAKYDAKATFFVLGKHAAGHLDIVKRIYEAGHEIGNHSWGHKRLLFRLPAFIRREISATDRIIRESGYAGPIPFRSPYGSRLIMLPYFLMKSRRVHVLWNVTLGDWDSPDPQEILRRFEERASPGSIVLLHDGYPNKRENRANTVEALEMILREYADRGYRFVTISELLRMGKTRSGIVF